MANSFLKFFGLQHRCLHGNLVFIEDFLEIFTVCEAIVQSTCVDNSPPWYRMFLRAAVVHNGAKLRNCIPGKGLRSGEGVTPSEARGFDGAHDDREAIGSRPYGRHGPSRAIGINNTPLSCRRVTQAPARLIVDTSLDPLR
jgi:hypothetical protein